MRSEAFIASEVMPAPPVQQSHRIVVDTAAGAKYKCWKYKQSHGPNLYYGFTRDPIEVPGGGRRFAAAVLQNMRDGRGRKRRFPVGVALFRSQREAREAALLAFCGFCGLPVDRFTPGRISYKERRRLLERLDGARQLITLVGPALHIPCDERETEQKSTKTKAAVSEPEVLGKNADNADAEAAQAPQLTTEAHEHETGETPIPSRPLSFARLVAAITKAGKGVLAFCEGHRPTIGSRQ